MGSQTMPAARRHVGAMTAAVVTLGIVFGVAVVLGRDGGTPSGTSGPRTEPTVLGEQILDIDLGPVTDLTVIATCLAPGFATDPSAVEVLYAVSQRSTDGEAPALLLRATDGRIRLCDAAGPDSPARLPLPSPSNSNPVAFLTNGHAVWDCRGRTLDAYRATLWLAVGPQVERVQLRYVVDGLAGPWFTSRARDGYAHLQTWLEGPLNKGTPLAVQTRAVDAAGELVTQSSLPAQQQLAGCSGGDARIG